MRRSEIPRLFDLLEQLYQGKRKARDEVTVAIWAEVLKPWPYEQVRDAVIRRARENRFFPDPSEITEYLPAIQEEQPEGDAKRYTCPDPKYSKMVVMYTERLREETQRLGIPEFSGKTGAEMAAWFDMCEEAGVDFVKLHEEAHYATYGR